MIDILKLNQRGQRGISPIVPFFVFEANVCSPTNSQIDKTYIL